MQLSSHSPGPGLHCCLSEAGLEQPPPRRDAGCPAGPLARHRAHCEPSTNSSLTEKKLREPRENEDVLRHAHDRDPCPGKTVGMLSPPSSLPSPCPTAPRALLTASTRADGVPASPWRGDQMGAPPLLSLALSFPDCRAVSSLRTNQPAGRGWGLETHPRACEYTNVCACEDTRV